MKQTLLILTLVIMMIMAAASMNTITATSTVKPKKSIYLKFSDADFDCQRFRHSSNRKK